MSIKGGAKTAINQAAKADEIRVFFFSQKHVDDYNSKYAKNDVNNYGATRHLVAKDANGQTRSFEYTHTTIIPNDADLEEIQREHKIEDARLVWRGPRSRAVFFGPKGSMPTIRRENKMV